MNIVKSLTKRGPALALLITALILLAGYVTLSGIFRQAALSHRMTEHPEYLNFSDNYVFAIPKDFNVYDRAILGAQVLAQNELKSNNLEDAYQANAIVITPLSGLSGNNSEAFKKYVTNTYIPNLKKTLSSDIRAQAGKVDELDSMRITVVKNNKPLRFIYLKNGQHPVEVVAKEESDAFKKVEHSIGDVETSDLGAEFETIVRSIGKVWQLIQDQKGHELYGQAGAGLRANTSEEDLIKGLKAAEPYTSKKAVTINGGGYNVNPDEIAVVMHFEPVVKDAKPASGVMYLDKINGQWQLSGLKLPWPTNPQAAPPSSNEP